MLTRLHRADIVKGGEIIRKTFASFKRTGRGVFIYLRDGAPGVPVTIADAPPPASDRPASDSVARG